MPDDFSLLSERCVRLHVGIRGARMSRTKWFGVQPFDRFPVEVVRGCASLLDEIPTQVQVALITGQTIKADESQLDFRMPTIPWQF